MAAESGEVSGPIMICATPVLKSDGARVGRVAGMQLPRTVKIAHLVAIGIGALAGLAVAVMFNSGLSSIVYGVAIGGSVGWFAVSYSPLPGESLAKWLELQLASTRRSRYIDGARVTVSVGVAYLPSLPRGRTTLRRAAVHVNPGTYDERGVQIAVRNRNVNGADHWLAAALSLPTDDPNAAPADLPQAPAVADAHVRAAATSVTESAAPPLQIPARPRRLKD